MAVTELPSSPAQHGHHHSWDLGTIMLYVILGETEDY